MRADLSESTYMYLQVVLNTHVDPYINKRGEVVKLIRKKTSFEYVCELITPITVCKFI